MSPFSLPITVRGPDVDVDLVIDLSEPTTLDTVLPELVACAGLPAGSVLHLTGHPVNGSWTLGRPPLFAGAILSTTRSDSVDHVGPLHLSCVAGPDAGRGVTLDHRPLVIGRGPHCDLTLDDPELSRRHARVSHSDEGLLVTDLRSANGVRVDGVSRPPADRGELIPIGSLIRLGGSILRVGRNTEPVLLLTPDGSGHLAVARPARVAPPFDHQLPPPVGPAPARSRRPIPVLAALVGAALGAAIAVVTGMWTFLLLAALGPLMMLFHGVSDRASGRRSHRRAMSDHRAALAEEAVRLEAAVVADRLDAWERYPDPATLSRRASARSTGLWARRREDPDFLVVTLGVGRRAARVDRTDPPPAAEVPITVDLAAVGVLGISGECRPMIRHLLAQLAALHSPADLHLSVFSGHKDLARARDLPHIGLDGGIGRFPTADSADAEVSRLLTDTSGRVNVVLLDDAHRWRRLSRMNELLAAAQHHSVDGTIGERGRTTGAPGSRLVAICVATAVEALPLECTAIATVRAGHVHIAGGRTTADADAAGVSPAYLERLVVALAPLIDPDAPGSAIPRTVMLSDLLPGRGTSASMAARWQSPSTTAVIGVGAAGPVSIDLERDGPHLLIAGTTGSGKSELLQTLTAGLAHSAAPDRMAFLLVDYKGGAAFGRLAELPHTTGLVTDLDSAIAVRALAGLRAEVRRREVLLAEAGAGDLAALRSRRPGAAPPALIIVVDEFATLGAELPDFLAGLLDVAQRGRSLGLHLVLATQRPAGVVSPAIKANVGLRICLRVTDDADSVDVIDTPDAARLRADLPGRALLRRERAHTQEFQVAGSSGARFTGSRVRLRDFDPTVPGRADNGPAARSDLDEIVDAAVEASAGIARPVPPWLPPLPVRFEPHEPDVIGLVDRPGEQDQLPWRTPTGSVLVLGPPGSGRSSALRRLGWTAAAAGAELLVIDAGDGLRDLVGWPATRTHLDGQDPLLIQCLVSRVQAELRIRAEVVGPPIVLLIDGWEVISGPLDGLDYGVTLAAIADLAARGPASGIRVVISGDLRLRHHRMAGAFTSTLQLGVDERGEITTSPAGRGRLDSAEIQCAHCPKGVPPPLPPTEFRPTAEVAGRSAIVVRPLPPAIPLSELPAATPGAVPIGVGGDAASPVSLDLRVVGGGLLVTGPRRSGVSNTLLVLATGAAAAGIRVIRGCLRPIASRPCVQDVDLRGGVAGLRRLLADHEGPILLIADEVDSWPEDAAALLEQFLAAAGPAQYLALGARLERAMRSHRGPIAEVAAMRNGIMLQADAADGVLLDTVLPRRRGELTPGRGHLVRDGRAVPLQVADAALQAAAL